MGIHFQASLAIDPSALMGGAKAKVLGSQTSNVATSSTRATMVDSTASNGATTIDFDAPAVTNTLPSYNKVTCFTLYNATTFFAMIKINMVLFGWSVTN